MRSESESASHSSTPQLKRVRVISAFALARVCAGTISLILIENQHFHSSTVSQYSATRNTHTHESDESPAKMSGGRADNWLLFKESPLCRGETERRRNRELGNQL